VALGFTFYVVYPQMTGPLMPGLNRTDEAPVPVVEPAPRPAPQVVAPTVLMEEAEAMADYDTGKGLAPSVSAAPPPGEMRLRTEAPLGGIVADDIVVMPEPDTEAYANEAPNPLKITAEEPVSTFSIDVDTASYAVIRSSLMAGYLPGPEMVRIEEMVNYFPYQYPAPDGAHPFQPTVTVMDTPWNTGTQLVHIAIQGELPALDERPPLNLVFLIDTSGSMQDANRASG
jgi:Ca-activated chloride channel family protein